MLNEIKKSIASGILISIGGCVYMASVTAGISWFGALLFCGGLFAICVYGFNLYTGKVGYIAYNFKDGSYWALVALVCVVNLLTTFLIGIIVGKYFPAIRESACKAYAAKLSAPLAKSFISAVFCGILMFLSVDTWKKGQKIGLFIYVPVFIIAGFDHSIANSFYNGVALNADTFTLKNLVLVLAVVAGNGIGGWIFPLLTKNQDKSEEK